METGIGEWPEYLKAFTSLLAMVDPPFVIPLFLGLVAGLAREQANRIALVGVIGFTAAMMVFLFFGETILHVLGISVPAFQLAGGLLLILMALEMLRAHPPAPDDEVAPRQAGTASSIALVPLAIPILAGPGALSTVVLFSSNREGIAHDMALAGVILAIAALTYTFLRLATLVEPWMTANVQLVFNKIMGLIVAAIAFEFIMHGIAGHFPDLRILDH